MGNRTEIVLATQDPPSSGGFKRNFWLNTATGKNFTWSADQGKYVEGGTGGGSGSGNLVDTKGIGIGAIGLCLNGPSVGHDQYSLQPTDKFLTYSSTNSNVQLSVLPSALADYFLSSITPAYSSNIGSPINCNFYLQKSTPPLASQKKCVGFFLWMNDYGYKDICTVAAFQENWSFGESPEVYTLATSNSGNLYTTYNNYEYNTSYDSYSGSRTAAFADYWGFSTGLNVYGGNFRKMVRNNYGNYNALYVSKPHSSSYLVGGFCIDRGNSTELLIARGGSGQHILYMSGFNPTASSSNSGVNAGAWSVLYTDPGASFIKSIGYKDNHYFDNASYDKLYVFAFSSGDGKFLICPHYNMGSITTKTIPSSLMQQVYPGGKYDAYNNICTSTCNALPLEVSEDGTRIVISCPNGVLTSGDGGDTWHANTDFRGLFKVRRVNANGTTTENFYSLHKSRLLMRIDPSTGAAFSYNSYMTNQYIQAIVEIANYFVPYKFNEEYRNYYHMPHFLYVDDQLFASSGQPTYSNASNFAFCVKNFGVIQDETAQEKYKTPNIMPVYPYYDGGSLKVTSSSSSYDYMYGTDPVNKGDYTQGAGILMGNSVNYLISNRIQHDGHLWHINRSTSQLEKINLSTNVLSVVTSGAQLTTTGNLAITKDPYSNNKIYFVCAAPIDSGNNQNIITIDPDTGVTNYVSTSGVGYYNVFDVRNVSAFGLCAYGGHNDGTDHLGTIRFIYSPWGLQGTYGVVNTIWNFTGLPDTENVRVFSNGLRGQNSGEVDCFQIAIPHAHDSIKLVCKGNFIGEFFFNGTSMNMNGSRTPLTIYAYVCVNSANAAVGNKEVRFEVRSLGSDGTVITTIYRMQFDGNLDNLFNGYNYFGYMSAEQGDGVNQPRFSIVSDTISENNASFLDRNAWENLYRTYEYGRASNENVYVGDVSVKSQVTLPVINSTMTHYLQLKE